METHCVELVFKFVVWLAMLPIIAVPIIILRWKKCTAEINVIWYAFSLVFVLWWCLHLAINLNIVRLPVDEALVPALKSQDANNPPSPTRESGPATIEEQERIAQKEAEDRRKAEELRRRLQEGEPWTGRYFYQKAKEYLTDTRAELGLVAVILIVTIAPQLLNYILAGLSGCAATPRLVWQFEKIATWSLIKFLAAFGGILVADALGVYTINIEDRGSILFALDGYVDDLLWGAGLVGLAFFVAVIQVYTLETADALGHALHNEPRSWPSKVHRFFTRNLPRQENKPNEKVLLPTFDARQIWDKLTPAQQQELGALVVRALLDGRKDTSA
jgi:hypothetical protein